jgi:Trypsin-like peptidase domain
MPINIQIQRGPVAEKNIKFGDDIDIINIGRDSTQCQVVFLPDETLVGRQHCVLLSIAGRYRLETNGNNLVLVNGVPVVGNLDLKPDQDTELQLGRGGPIVRVHPTLNADLPPTVGRVSQPGLATITRDAYLRSRKSMQMALIGLALLLMVSCGGLLITGLLKNDQTMTTKRMETVEQEVKNSSTIVSGLLEISEKHREEVRALTNNLQGAGGRGDLAETGIIEALAKARDSVYLVVRVDSKERMAIVGTSWVVDRKRGYLATNAHVAEVFTNLPAEVTMMVLSPGPKSTKLKITEAVIHPGYASFGSLWNEYRPVRRFDHSIDTIQGVPGFDVALFKVDKPELLAADIPRATEAEIEQMSPGLAIGYVGYPSENVALGGVNLDSPAPTTRLGNITAITNYFNAATASAKDRLLIQHSAASSGGASGSPMVDKHGHVLCVHNAGNFINAISVARVGSPANIQYAQSVDLVSELLDGTASAKQAVRDKELRRVVAEHFKPRKEVEVNIAREDVDEVYRLSIEEANTNGEFNVSKTIVKTLTQVPSKDVKMNDGSTWYMPEVEMTLDKPGVYSIVAAAGSDVTLTLSAHEKDDENDIVSGNLAVTNSVEALWFETTKARVLTIEPRVNYGDAEILIEAARWEKTRKPVEELHRLLVESWSTATNETKPRNPPEWLLTQEISKKEVAKYFQEINKTAEGAPIYASKFMLKPKTTGAFLLTLVSLNAVNMQIAVFKSDSEQPDASAEGTWISMPVEIPEGSTQVEGVVLSLTKTPYQLRMYK